MSTFSGYTLLDEVAQFRGAVLLRGMHAEQGLPVLLKILKDDYPSPSAIARLKAEFELIRELRLPGVLEPVGFAHSDHRAALIFENFTATSLRRLITVGPMDFARFLQIALPLADTLGELHRRDIIHKSLTPEGVLVDAETGRIKLTDFSLATRLERGPQGPGNLQHVAERLAYLSPEQTGRMNRAVDARSDLYALGVVLYEMLTGVKPFSATDPIELIHGHIARQPLPPEAHRPGCPPVLSHMVLKLLAKMAEDRYQSAPGLAADLREASRRLKGASWLEDFPLGQQDISSAFSIPGKLYGRERELKQLLAAVERVSIGSVELLLMSGYAGIGKTSLVNELHRHLVVRRGSIASGKFDQLHRNVPYSSLAQAFRQHLRALLTEEPSAVAAWKDRLLEAVSPNGRLLADLLPELEVLLGPQPSVPELPSAESQARFHRVFEQLIAALTGPEHPLVLFLDDMQWADSASLALLQQLLVNPASRSLLLLCAYRDNEVSPAHPFMLLADQLRQEGQPVIELHVGPLTPRDVRQLLAETLGVEPEAVEALANTLLAKTQGNPFFIKQLLHSLHASGLFSFDHGARRWQWALEPIAKAPHTENVLTLMAEKLRRLPREVQEVLKLAACVGNLFDVLTLSRISETSLETVEPLLWEAAREGLLIPGSDAHEKLHSSAEGERYRFLHDRVQQAAYSLIAVDDRPAVHLKIGRLLWRQQAPPEGPGFGVIDQLNLGLEVLHNEAERQAVAQLNLQAGRRAKASSAYASAAAYFRIGRRLLGWDGWQTRFELLWLLTVELAECEYLLTRFPEAEALFDLAMARARTRLQMTQVYTTKIILYTTLGKYLEACRCGVAALRLFEVDWPEDDAAVSAALERERQEIEAHLRGRKLEELEALPEETDPDRLALGMVLAYLISPFFQGFENKAREQLITCTLVNQVLRTGKHSDAGAYGLASYAHLLASAKDYANSHALGKLAIEVAERHGFNMSKRRNYNIFGGLINHWTQPARTSSAYLLRAFKLLSESGDLAYSVYACCNLISLAAVRGDPLEQVDGELQRYFDFVRQSQNSQYIQDLLVYRHWIRCLKGQLQKPWSLPGDRENTRPSRLWPLHQMKILYMAGRHQEALEAGVESERSTSATAAGTLLVPESRFYFALSIAAAGRGPRGEDLRELLPPFIEDFRSWALGCPANFRQQQVLLQAEWARLSGQDLEAMSLYDEAVKAAGESGYLHIEALSNELAGRFHLHGGRTRVAQSYLREARYAYARWGATALVAELEARYPELLGRRAAGGEEAPVASAELTGSVLDLMTVTWSSQVLSGELHLRSLLEKLIRLVMEHAGSQRSVLLLSRENGLFIEAEATVDQPEATVLQSHPVSSAQSLPKSVINYVAHSRDCLVLRDALSTPPYQSDPYVRAHRTRSILCLPVLAHKKLVGLLYLEHHLATDVFTSDRLQVLTLLSAQAAISIENALLYNTLEQRVEARTRELNEKNDQLVVTLHRLRETQQLLVEKEKLASLGSMTAAIAHEVKNPLNFINNFAQLAQEQASELRTEMDKLGQSPSPDKLEEIRDMTKHLVTLTSKIDEHGKRVDRIINSMRQHSSGSRASRVPVDLNRLLAEHVSLIAQGLRMREPLLEVQLTESYDSTLGLVGVAPGELGQVIVNLVNNAYQAVIARHRKAPGEPPRVKVSSRNLGSHAEVRIWDNGVGIAPEARSKIFSPFFTTKKPGEGTGLGLSLSYNIVVQSHGGELRFESEPGLGTEFIVTLPRS
ncbi:AAA family ATPase [Stigmatella sp. ncwal1]|uniref:histidine kinase n=1 Tax=Stigmatella ashevillensis TaxID=2995309 RepID=A0ABT5DHX5_9BACT|nr:AAA family ATPase [Stigmatella ashevillena]MDC0713179.1 AAA family ATPase [Stigmatella ashevillena]